jgi:AhpD family alkylhydroperoxidase
MSFIRTVPVSEATGEVRAMYERSQAGPGYVPNYAKAFSHRPQAYAAWGALLGSVRATMDPRRYELVTVAAARALGCSYCALAHGKILRDRFYTAPELAAIVDGRAGAVSEADAALMAFAERVARDASAITAGPTRRSSTSPPRPRPAASSASSSTRWAPSLTSPTRPSRRSSAIGSRWADRSRRRRRSGFTRPPVPSRRHAARPDARARRGARRRPPRPSD